MKKIIAVITMMVMCLNLVACGNDTKEEPVVEDTVSVVEITEATEPNVIENTEPIEIEEENVTEAVEKTVNIEKNSENNVENKESFVKDDEVTEEIKNDSDNVVEEIDEIEQQDANTVSDNTENEEKEVPAEEVHGEMDAPEEEPVVNTSVSHSANALEQGILDSINAYRAEAGLNALTYDGSLYTCASTRASECAYKFEHTRPNGENFTSIFAECGVAWDALAGENVGRYFNDAKTAMDAFMASQVHKDNILYPGYSRVCIAAVESAEYPGYYIIEQLFMGPQGSY